MMPNEHIPDPLLIDYALAEEFDMPEDEAKTIRDHISECESCRRQYEKFAARYHDFAVACDPVDHFNQLQNLAGKQSSGRKLLYWSAAAALLIAFSWGTTSRYMNHQFDHGETGLAAFYEDYQYAKIPVTFRDNQAVESPDSKLFREAVLTLFEAKTSILGLFPDYNVDQVLKAERLFSKAAAETVHPNLKEKIGMYQEKIRLILAKKEIKK